jgi:fructose-specific PTS system IIB-like component
MFIVAVTACPTGVAHTYMAREKLVQVAQKRGIEIKVETQGSTGRENEITAADLARADAAIIAAAVSISGMERFADIPTLECSLAEAIKKTNNVFDEVVEAVS